MNLALLAFVTFAFSLIGGTAPVLLHARISVDTSRRLAGIAGGLLIGSALLVVVPEGLHVAEEAIEQNDSFFADRETLLTSLILLGFVVMLILEGLGIGHAVHEEHHQHEASHGHGHVHHPESMALLPIGLSIHAAADGLAIGAAETSSTTAATLITLAVIAHKMPAAFSLGVFLTHHHESKSRVIRDVALFSAATPALILVSSWLLEGSLDLAAASLLFSAGTFLYVSTVDTLPMVHSPKTGRSAALYLSAGALFVLALLVVFDLAGWDAHPH